MNENTFNEEISNETQNEESTQPIQEATNNSNTGTIAYPTKEQWEERNIANLREKALRAERERDDALRYVREMEAKKQQPIAEEIEEEINLGADEIAEGKHLYKVQQQIKSLKNEIKKYKQESLTSTVENKIRANYPDFDSVVSRSNLEELKNNYPEIVQTLYSSTDEYSKAASAYTLIKKLGIDTMPNYDADKQRVAQNMAKPRPLASIPVAQNPGGALQHANAFATPSKDQMASYWKEMEEARKAY